MYIWLSLLFWFFGVAVFAKPVKYKFDPYHTNVIWQAGHFGFSQASGKFTDVSGVLKLDEKKPEKSSLEVVINTASLVTGIEAFDEHLKSADFLNVDKFPTATFESTKVSLISDKQAKVEGNLTLLGVKKPLVLDVKLNKIGENPYNKTKTAGFSASAIIKRSDFGIKYALPDISDEVKISIEVEANPIN